VVKCSVRRGVGAFFWVEITSSAYTEISRNEEWELEERKENRIECVVQLGVCLRPATSGKFSEIQRRCDRNTRLGLYCTQTETNRRLGLCEGKLQLGGRRRSPTDVFVTYSGPPSSLSAGTRPRWSGCKVVMTTAAQMPVTESRVLQWWARLVYHVTQ